MGVLRDLLAGSGEGNLDEAALEIARFEYPELDLAANLLQLDSLARELRGRVADLSDGPEFVLAARKFLFHELGFHGNEVDYYSPRNSCLNHVLERRTGIPITLSVLYLEIARRLEMPVFGVGLPRHFVVEYNDGTFSTYIDPFHDGRFLKPADCYELAGARVADPALLRRASKREILARMLHNLRAAYVRAQRFDQALNVLDLMIDTGREPADALKQRAILNLQQKRFARARQDLERYLDLVPDAPDRAEVREQIQALARWIASVN